jgi:tetratricopeptide (TPR) repeat protein
MELPQETEFRRALQSNQSYAIAHTWYGVDLAAMGRYREAMAQARLAEALDPLSLTVITDIGLISYLAGRNEEAIDWIRRAIEIDPSFPRFHFRLGNAYLQKDMNQQALAEYQKAVQLSTDKGNYADQYHQATVGTAYGILGMASEARGVLNVLLAPFATPALRLRQPGPESAEPFPLPTDDGVGVDVEDQRMSPVGPQAAESDPKYPVEGR